MGCSHSAGTRKQQPAGSTPTTAGPTSAMAGYDTTLSTKTGTPPNSLDIGVKRLPETQPRLTNLEDASDEPLHHSQPTTSSTQSPRLQQPTSSVASRDYLLPSPNTTGEDQDDRSFMGSDLNSSFRNSSFISDKGDCRVDKLGFIAPTPLLFQQIVASPERVPTTRPCVDADLISISSHSSDCRLVLICIDCGMEVTESSNGAVCPLTAKLHA